MIVSGRMGSGKGLSWADWTARITTGQDWPDRAANTLGGPKMVLIAAPEDDPKRTLRPRLEAAGADLGKVFWLKRTEKVETVRRKTSKAKRQMLLERDLLNIANALSQYPDIVLVILDPLSSFFSIKMTDDREMRPVMDAISLMCSKTGASVLAVSHTNKRSDVDSTQRVLGASCVAGTARIIWNFAHNPDDKEERLMSLVKSNVGATAGQKFQVKKTEITLADGSEAETAVCKWLGDHNEDADEVASRAKDNRQQGDRKVDLAMAFIRLNLSTGIKMASELYELAEQQEGLSVDVMKRAKNKLGNIQVRKIGHHWHWGTEEQFADDPVMEPEAMEAAM
jgi:putative DNA primase/helicase